MDGIPSEALVALMLWVVAGSTVLGVAFSLLALAAHNRCGRPLEVLIGAAFVAVVAYPLANFDLIDLGGNIAWRVVVFVGALSAGYLASRALIRHRRPSGLPPKPVAVVVGLATVVFAAAGASVLGLLLVISLAFQ